MAGARVVRSSKEIMGVDDFIGAEWDAGYIPAGAAHRRVRVTVRKDASDKFVVYCVAHRGDIKLASWDIKTFPCETCAKAFALCLVFGSDYAACSVHERGGFGDSLLFDGSLAVICCLMGVSKTDYVGLDDYVLHRVKWVVRLIMDGQVSWLDAIRAWEATEQVAAQRGWSFPAMMGWWFAEISRKFYDRIQW